MTGARAMRVLVLILFALLSVSGVGAQAELPPYIHYFDHLRGGLVIERADGTDSRMIPDVPMDAGPPVWSPSGKWMVIGHKMIVSTDGSKRPPDPLPALIGYYPQTLWSPKDDVILAIGFEATSRSILAQLYDVEAQAILANFEFQNPTFGEGSLDLYWEPDGTRAFVSWPGGVVTLYRDGQTALWLDPRYGATPDFYQGRLFSSAGQTDEVLMLRIGAFNGEKQIDIEDRIELSRDTYIVRWSPTLEHALIYAQKCSDTHCDGWLKLVDWETETVQPVVPTIAIVERDYHCYAHTCAELWSPDGRYAVLTDKEGAVHLLDAATGEFRQIATDKTVTDYEWSPESQLLLNYEEEAPLYEQMHIYDPATDHVRDIALPIGTLQNGITQYSSFYPSIDERYIALRNETPTVIDENGTVVVETIRHSYSTQSYSYPDGYTWHPDGRWLMANYVIAFAGGGYGPIAAVLFDIDGTTRRELPKGGRAGFVSDQVIPHLATGQPTSVKKDPMFILPQKGIVDGVGWHPNDPDQLVTHSREDGLIFWSLAGSQPEIIRHEILAFPFPAPLPVGLRLFWVPERDVVAFWDGRAMVTIDQATGEAVPVEGVDYPCNRSDRVLQVETAHLFVSCGETSILYWALTSDRLLTYANKETGVITPLDTGGRTDDIWTGDAHNGVAAVGGIWDCCIAIASTETGALLDEFHGTAYHLAISADGRRLATTSAGMTAIWDISEYTAGE